MNVNCGSVFDVCRYGKSREGVVWKCKRHWSHGESGLSVFPCTQKGSDHLFTSISAKMGLDFHS